MRCHGPVHRGRQGNVLREIIEGKALFQVPAGHGALSEIDQRDSQDSMDLQEERWGLLPVDKAEDLRLVTRRLQLPRTKWNNQRPNNTGKRWGVRGLAGTAPAPGCRYVLHRGRRTPLVAISAGPKAMCTWSSCSVRSGVSGCIGRRSGGEVGMASRCALRCRALLLGRVEIVTARNDIASRAKMVSPVPPLAPVPTPHSPLPPAVSQSADAIALADSPAPACCQHLLWIEAMEKVVARYRSSRPAIPQAPASAQIAPGGQACHNRPRRLPRSVNRRRDRRRRELDSRYTRRFHNGLHLRMHPCQSAGQ